MESLHEGLIEETKPEYSSETADAAHTGALSVQPQNCLSVCAGHLSPPVDSSLDIVGLQSKSKTCIDMMLHYSMTGNKLKEKGNLQKQMYFDRKGPLGPLAGPAALGLLSRHSLVR